MTRAKLTPAMVTAKINTAKLRADATAAVGIDLSLDGDPSPFAAVAIVCCDEIDRLRADLATASGACETWKSDARRLAADVAAMLPIVEGAAGEVAQPWCSCFCCVARRFLDARKEGT